MIFGNNGYGCGGYGMFGGGWNFLIPLLIIIVIAFAGYQLLKSNDHPTSNIALNDLNRKFVNGEITEEEYIQKKQILKK